MMHRGFLLILLLLIVVATGCGKPDPKTRPGYIDTTDPRKGVEGFMKMKPPPKENQAKPGGS